jgi:hypothetical protein
MASSQRPWPTPWHTQPLASTSRGEPDERHPQCELDANAQPHLHVTSPHVLSELSERRDRCERRSLHTLGFGLSKQTRQQQDWILMCLHGRRAHPLSGLWGGDALLLPTLKTLNPELLHAATYPLLERQLAQPCAQPRRAGEGLAAFAFPLSGASPPALTPGQHHGAWSTSQRWRRTQPDAEPRHPRRRHARTGSKSSDFSPRASACALVRYVARVRVSTSHTSATHAYEQSVAQKVDG